MNVFIQAPIRLKFQHGFSLAAPWKPSKKLTHHSFTQAVCTYAYMVPSVYVFVGICVYMYIHSSAYMFLYSFL